MTRTNRLLCAYPKPSALSVKLRDGLKRPVLHTGLRLSTKRYLGGGRIRWLMFRVRTCAGNSRTKTSPRPLNSWSKALPPVCPTFLFKLQWLLGGPPLERLPHGPYPSFSLQNSEFSPSALSQEPVLESIMGPRGPSGPQNRMPMNVARRANSCLSAPLPFQPAQVLNTASN